MLMAYGCMASGSSIDRNTAEVFARLSRVGRSQKELADAIGIDADKVSKTKSGQRQLKAPELIRANEWLARLEGAENQRSISPAATDDTVEIAQLDLSLSMGPGTLIEDFVEAEPVKFDLALIQSITRTPSDRLRLVRGIGDSMEPTLRTGDRVMVDINERALARINGIYWIDHLGTHGIKRLRAASRNKVMVISDNPHVPDFEADAEDLRIEGRVIWFAREL